MPPKRTKTKRLALRRKGGGREGKRVSTAGPAVNSFRALTGGFPDKVRVRLNYNEVVPVTGISQTQVWNANNVFDPNQTGTGGQPYNFDDFAVQYNRYRVLGSSCKATFSVTGLLVGAFSARMLVCPRHTATSIVSTQAVAQDAIAAPYGKWKHSVSVNAAAHYQLSNKMSTAKFLGFKRNEVKSSDQLQALTTGAPADPWYWHTSIIATDAATQITGYLFVELCYDVEFFDRNEVTLDSEITSHAEYHYRRWREIQAAKKLYDLKKQGQITSQQVDGAVFDDNGETMVIPRDLEEEKKTNTIVTYKTVTPYVADSGKTGEFRVSGYDPQGKKVSFDYVLGKSKTHDFSIVKPIDPKLAQTMVDKSVRSIQQLTTLAPQNRSEESKKT